MGYFKNCADNHGRVLYDGDECPVCLIREQLDEKLDAKTDIDQENILDLFKRVETIEKIIQKSDAGRYWWPRKS